MSGLTLPAVVDRVGGRHQKPTPNHAEWVSSKTPKCASPTTFGYCF